MTAKLDPNHLYSVPEALRALGLPYRRGLRWVQRADERCFAETGYRILRNVSEPGAKRPTYVVKGSALIAWIDATGEPEGATDVERAVDEHEERIGDVEEALKVVVGRIERVERRSGVHVAAERRKVG